ncbi:efflux RND transporter permease subunit [candidate division KSB1 bacterium]|nr:efflux RND transporter permease subunit [candidate division KSB1 bacterium]
MRLPKIAIDNHQVTIIITIALALSGILSFMNMPRSEDPQVSKSGASIIVLYPGANPANLEQLVVEPIEEALNGLEDINQINSTMLDGLSMTGIEFETGTDPDEKYSDVIQKINSIRPDLPSEIFSIRTIKWSVSDVNILQLAILADSVAYRTLEDEAERLKKKLEKIDGVKNIKIWAVPEQEIRVALNMEKMAQQRISLNQCIQAIQSANLNIPGGSIDLGTKRFSIQTSGNYKSLDDIQNTIIQSDGAKIVYLKDIAHINFNYEDLNYYARLNGTKAIFVTVMQKEHTNIFQIMEDLKRAIEDYKTALPPSMTLHYAFDQSESVSYRISNFFSNLFQGILLVGIMIFISLNFRASLIVMLAIPLSIMIGITFVDLSGFSLEQMSIAGLVIALGILVDNAIVVTENVTRFLNLGYDHKTAAIKATQQIGWAVVSSTVTTVLAFVPIVLMEDITGDFIRSMPVTVIFTLSASLMIAITLTPYLSSKLLMPTPNNNSRRITRLINYFVEKHYRKTLAYALKHGRLIIILAGIILLLSLSLFPLVGVTFFPKAEKPQFIINIETPKGTSLDKTDEVARFVESKLFNYPQIKHFVTNIGRSNPRIYYNTFEHYENSTFAQVFIELKNRDLEQFNQTITNLRKEFAVYPNARIEVKEFEQGPPVDAPISIRVLGDNLDVLKALGRDVEQIFTTTPGTINIVNPLKTSKMDLHVKINRDKAGMSGVPLHEIDRTIRTCISGIPISRFRDLDGEEYNIVLRLPIQKKPQLADFDKIYIASMSGKMIPLKQIAAIEFLASPQEINHHNLEREVTITADVLSEYSVDKTTRSILGKLRKYNWPKGYRFEIGGEHETRGTSFGGMMQAIVIAMLGIFAVLVLQFRSFIQPLIIFAAIPLAIIGSIIALLVTGNSFSFTAFIGLTSLVGIVVNNSIILVDYTNQLRQDGLEIEAALKQAGETRFLPILLTSGTTIGGLLPLTLRGGTLWAPMGWTIIGGLFVSTVLTLIVVPILYKMFSTNQKLDS